MKLLLTNLQAGGGFDPTTLVMMGLMFVVFYFFIIRPQMNRQKKEKKFQESLKTGMRVVTNSGIHGKIAEISPDSITVETGAGKIKFEKNAVSQDLSVARYPENEGGKIN